MKILASLKRPEYVFRPSQIIRRLMFELRPATAEYVKVRLPWGLSIRVQPEETVGSGIRRMGIYELATSEIISRLVDPGDLAVDIGANIGHMTSIMAMRAGPTGRVISFEPHPVLFRDLQHNISEWRMNGKAAPMVAHNVALSNCNGTGQLVVPAYFNGNHGVSFLAGDSEATSEANHYEVPLKTLDDEIEEGQQIGFMKIDVEGHELKVLQGAQRLIASGRIRDIIFEDFTTPPSSVTEFLEGNGYKIYRIAGEFWGPTLTSIKTPYAPKVNDAPNYLATRDDDRVLARMAKRGWMVYSGR
jgi:FkbM family methyltransferase